MQFTPRKKYIFVVIFQIALFKGINKIELIWLFLLQKNINEMWFLNQHYFTVLHKSACRNFSCQLWKNSLYFFCLIFKNKIWNDFFQASFYWFLFLVTAGHGTLIRRKYLARAWRKIWFFRRQKKIQFVTNLSISKCFIKIK